MIGLTSAGVMLTGLLSVLPQPTLTTPPHLGATRGQKVETILTGTHLKGVTEVKTSFAAKVTIPPGQTDDKQLRVTLNIPADAPLGPHTIQVGVSQRPFAIDDLPQVIANGTNRSWNMAQPIPVPCVIMGAVTAEQSDYYRFRVKAGQPVTLDALARRLDTDLDPVLLFRDANGAELPTLAVDDTPGLKGDARRTVMFNSDRDLIVEIRDTLFRGGPNFGYRLRVGDFPAVTTVFPLAVSRGAVSRITFPGHEDVEPVNVTGPNDPSIQTVFVTPRRRAGAAGWPMTVRVSDDPEVIEEGTMTRMSAPGGVSACFQTPDDRDVFVFSGQKGKKWIASAIGADLQFRILGPDGAEVGRSEPTTPDTMIEFVTPGDGDYRVECTPLNYVAGPEVVYHLRITVPRDDHNKKK